MIGVGAAPPRRRRHHAASRAPKVTPAPRGQGRGAVSRGRRRGGRGPPRATRRAWRPGACARRGCARRGRVEPLPQRHGHHPRAVRRGGLTARPQLALQRRALVPRREGLGGVAHGREQGARRGRLDGGVEARRPEVPREGREDSLQGGEVEGARGHPLTQRLAPEASTQARGDGGHGVDASAVLERPQRRGEVDVTARVEREVDVHRGGLGASAQGLGQVHRPRRREVSAQHDAQELPVGELRGPRLVEHVGGIDPRPRRRALEDIVVGLHHPEDHRVHVRPPRPPQPRVAVGVHRELQEPRAQRRVEGVDLVLPVVGVHRGDAAPPSAAGCTRAADAPRGAAARAASRGSPRG